MFQKHLEERGTLQIPEAVVVPSPSSLPNLLWFDMIEECLVNCQFAVIGNGALP